jgi:PAS domain S-box-containing protein
MDDEKERAAGARTQAVGLDLTEMCDWLGFEALSIDLAPRRVAFASPALLRRAALSADELTAELDATATSRWLEILFDDERDRARLRAALDGVRGASASFVYATQQPTRWRRAHVRLVATETGQRLDLVSHDITDVVESDRAARHAELVRRVTEAVYGAEDVVAGARAAAEILRDRFGVDRCAIMVVDELRGALGVRGVAGPDVAVPSDVAQAMLRNFLQLHGPSAQFADLATMPGSRADLLAAMGIRSLAFSQIGAGATPVGSISIATRETRHFSDDEMRLLTDIADALVGPLARKAFTDERRRAQEVVETAEERLRAALEAASTGIFEIDLADDTLHLDARCRELFGVEGAVMERQRFLAQVNPADLEAMRRAASGAASGDPDRAVEVQFRYESPRGTLWVSARGRLQRDANGAPRRIIGTVQDMTESRRLEDKLVATQKLESLGVLAGGIAHDFNNILTGILGSASLARLDVPPDSGVAHLLAEVERSAERAAELCRQLLAYSGRGRFDIRTLDPSRFVEETAKLIRASIPRTVELDLQLADRLPSVSADVVQLRQVVMNLLINAAEAIGDRPGRVVVSTSERVLTAHELSSFRLAPPRGAGRYVVLEVKDDGSGMSEATRARVFEPFFTTKFTGRGLGMSAVLGILRSHRGSLKVYSEPGRGTTFKVLLPVAEGPADPIASEVPASVVASGTAWVLVIDDEETVRTVTRRVLERAGYRVLTAPDGVDGLELFRERQGEIDVVLLDVTMPRMGGEETFRQLRLLRPDVRVVLASGYSEQEATSQFAGKGLAGFIEKPFRAVDLLAKLQLALQT